MISNYEKMLAVQRHVGRADRMKVIFNGIDTENIRKTAALSIISRRDVGVFPRMLMSLAWWEGFRLRKLLTCL